jgi:2-polyprenyl-3-methyl-5-hydroxy-6-metoxy-1,4-benzoquinol methylase
VLDFGCGPGVLSLTLASRGYEVLGVDGAPRMIEMARRERDRRGCPRANFEVMDAHSFELSRKFAAVVCSSVIEYVPDDMKLLRDLSSVLVPGGHLVISVPNAGSIFGVVEDCLSKVPAYRQSVGRRHLEFSLRRYTRKRFSRALESIGIRPRTHTYFEAPLPGGSGAALARLPAVGVMLLVVGQKVA